MVVATGEEDHYWQAATDWVKIEHQLYEDRKFSQEYDDKASATEWEERIGRYLNRAVILGLDNPLGRQAVGKAATAAMGYLESMIRQYGTIPAPGSASGVILGEFKI